MVKVLLSGIVVSTLLLIVGIARSHGDAATPPPLPTVASPEPITGSPVTPLPSNEPPPHEPFTPYPIGPAPTPQTPKPYWTYNDLTADEKAAVDVGRDVTGWQEIHNAYAAAAAERAHRAAGDAAQHQLGVDSLGTIGVIP